MSTVPSAPSLDTRARWWWVPYLYLLRVQIITGLVLLVAPPVALFSPLFRGLFDLDYGPWWHTATGMALVTLAAFSAAWTLLATTWATAHNAPERFGTHRINWVRYPITWPQRELFAVLAMPTVLTAAGYSWWASGVPVWTSIAGVVAGVVGAVAVLLLARSHANRLQRAVHRHAPRGVVPKLVRRIVDAFDRPNIREGFLDARTGELAQGHMLAWVVFTFSATLYAAIGIGKWVRIGYEANVPTLACVLLLLLMVCWLLDGLTFFFDRYRLPSLAVLGAVALIVGVLPLPGGDHVYRTMEHPPDASPWAHEVLRIGSRTPILIAATGGGIQAAAWTARVLTGIDQALSEKPADLRTAYTKSIRLLSTVSGGGVGAMYFAERYKAKGFDRRALDDVVAKAEASSLDDVAWGATYPDAIATFFPPVRSIFGDRGQALESAWTRSLDVARPLSEWRTEVWSDERPANIFNATLVDTGERFLIGTSRLGWHERRGLRNFEEVYERRDLQVVTAARLAASFTYVSPATRTAESRRAYHVVDGGYYDDYGMATLIEWLNEALEGVGGAGSFPRVLVIQIRSDPGEQRLQPDRWHGPFYQLWAPAETLLNVRSTGQISHNDEEFERLQKLWKEQHLEIDNVIFRFCGEHPPLSWHLTGLEKRAIESEWNKHVVDGRGLRAIQDFLLGQPLKGVDTDKPFDVPPAPCSPPGPSPWRQLVSTVAGGRK
jgi:hypothetical protein